MIRSLSVSLLVTSYLAMPALAQDVIDKFLMSEAALQCLNLTPAENKMVWRVEMDVTLAILGRVEAVTVLSYTPDDSTGRGIAQKAAEAASRCVPASVNLPGVSRIVLPDMANSADTGPVITLPPNGNAAN